MFSPENISFIKSVYNIRDLPKNPIPEYAFIGRSNVGKSSLVNLITGGKLAKTSSTPGKTVSLNYYDVAHKLHLVDLPGYGYAKLAKNVQKQISNLVGQYFLISKDLVLTFLLLDSRHQIKSSDIEILSMLAELDRKVFLVLTKCDKRSNLQLNWENQYKNLSEMFRNIEGMMYTSCKNKLGIKELRKLIISK